MQNKVIALIVIGLLLLLLLAGIFLFPPLAEATNREDWRFLGGLNAIFNSISTVCIALGVFFIKTRRQNAHQRAMLAAGVSSTAFLISYVLYHSFFGSVAFLGTGGWRPFYFSLLISHIILAAVALPVVLITFFLGLSRHFAAHRKLARYTAPLWLYVSFSGVVVYLLLKAFE